MDKECMDNVRLFLIEVTVELLYNIVFSNDEGINLETLQNIFKQKTGHLPMDLFDLGLEAEQEWSDLLKNVPGLEQCSQDQGTDDMVRIKRRVAEDDPNEKAGVYNRNNSTYVSSHEHRETFAAYREKLLIFSCKMIKKHFSNLRKCEDDDGYTPLHLIASLPGHYVDYEVVDDPKVPLLHLLFKTGIGILERNFNDQNLLQTMHMHFTIKHDDAIETSNFIHRRMNSFKISSEYIVERHVIMQMSQNELTTGLTHGQESSLWTNRDIFNDTLTHEWAQILSIQNAEAEFDSTQAILDMLLTNYETIHIPNRLGNVPLHYAFHPTIFKILLHDQQSNPRVYLNNIVGETPVLTLLQQVAALAFNHTSVSEKIDGLFRRDIRNALCQWMENKTTLIKEATKMLKQFKELVTDNTSVKEALWFSTHVVYRQCPINVILIAIRLGSYHFENNNLDYTEMRKCFVELLELFLPFGTTSQRNLQNPNNQNALHVLLDMGDGNNTIFNDEHILKSMEKLLEHNVNVNAVDWRGNTPLDIANKYHSERNEKFAEILKKHGAVVRLTGGEKRKLLSCPMKHKEKAQRLIDYRNGKNDNNDDRDENIDDDIDDNFDDKSDTVIVVGEYCYSSQTSIGSGAFSSVFVAVKDEFDNMDGKSRTINCRAYALKRIEKAKIKPGEFKREMRTLISVTGKCENIINYHETFDNESFHYIVLDLMDGNLNEFITNEDVRKAVEKDSAIHVHLMKEIIAGLTYLHDHNYIHRDLKPGNILYTTDPTLHLKIADFGLTKNVSTSSTMPSTVGSGVARGTRLWMAPELVSGRSKEHTKQSDTFSLGLVLYYLYTWGKHPFQAESGEPEHKIQTRIADETDAKTKVILNFHGASHPEAIDFFLALLSKDPSLRPPVNVVNQHPFLWSVDKKVEFLKVIGKEEEASHPNQHPNSALEVSLQTKIIGSQIILYTYPWDEWDQKIIEMYQKVTRNHSVKKYRTDKVIDLLRFIRNAYEHVSDHKRWPSVQADIKNNIFLDVYPALVLDVFHVVRDLRLAQSRDDIRKVLSN